MLQASSLVLHLTWNINTFEATYMSFPALYPLHIIPPALAVLTVWNIYYKIVVAIYGQSCTSLIPRQSLALPVNTLLSYSVTTLPSTNNERTDFADNIFCAFRPLLSFSLSQLHLLVQAPNHSLTFSYMSTDFKPWSLQSQQSPQPIWGRIIQNILASVLEHAFWIPPQKEIIFFSLNRHGWKWCWSHKCIFELCMVLIGSM